MLYTSSQTNGSKELMESGYITQNARPTLLYNTNSLHRVICLGLFFIENSSYLIARNLYLKKIPYIVYCKISTVR
jgi:hypothetical protein